MSEHNLIGLTGGIGSGKSTIADALREMGYPVYDCDSEAKRIMQTNMVVRSQIEYLFGSEAYQDDVYQPQLVAPQVFANPELLERLNRIVHPAVCFDVAHWARRQDQLCFVESAILFESKLNELCWKTIAVVAPEEVRIQRTMARDHATREKVVARIATQSSQEQLMEQCTFSICNDGNAPIQTLVQQLLNKLS